MVNKTLSSPASTAVADAEPGPSGLAAGDMLVCVSRAPEGERLVLDL